MNHLIKGFMPKAQLCALLVFGVAFLAACGSKPADPPVEAAPAPVSKVLTAKEDASVAVAGSAIQSPDTSSEPAQAMPAYDSSMPAVAPVQQVKSANEGPSTNSSPSEGLLEPVEPESDQSDLFVERAAIDALSEELFLEIINPTDDVEFVESSTFVLTARTLIDAAVSVNDDLVDVNEEGLVEAVLILEEGPNVIEVVTSVSSGEEKSAVLTIFYLP